MKSVLFIAVFLWAPPGEGGQTAATGPLTPDTVLVVGSGVEAFIVGSPKGMLRATVQAGPVSIRSKFYDGNGTVETRQYGNRYVYQVSAVPGANGQAELIVFPRGIADAGQIQRLTVTVGAGPAPPPDRDLLAPILQARFSAEPSPDKARLAAGLAKVYRDASAPSGMVNSGANKTVSDLLTTFAAARQQAVPDGSLLPLRTAISDEFRKTLNFDLGQQLDAATRNTFAQQFNRVAAILEGLK